MEPSDDDSRRDIEQNTARDRGADWSGADLAEEVLVEERKERGEVTVMAQKTEFELVCLEESKDDVEHRTDLLLGQEEEEVEVGRLGHSLSTDSRGGLINDDEEDEEDALTTKFEEDLNEVLRREDLYPWFNVILIAISVGAMEFIPLFFLGISINAKFEYLDEILKSSGLLIMTVCNVSFSLVCVIGAAIATSFVPSAAGSGVPALIAYLYNGRKTNRDLFTSQLVLVKMIGVELAIVGGLAVGREGPAIHIGAAIGDLTNRLINKCIRMYTGKKVPFSGAVKSNVVMMGATCGFASAFRSPVGGMLYCVEEIATHWDIKSHLSVGAQTFVAAAFAAITTQTILNVSSKKGHISFSSIVIFSEDEANEGTTTAAYQYHDLPGFLLIAVLCGILAGVITRLDFDFNRWRKKVQHSDNSRVAFMYLMMNAFWVAGVTTLCFSLVPLIYTDCKTEPVEHHDDEPHRMLSAGGDRSYVQYTCPDGEYSQLASLSLGGEEGVIRHLLSRDGEEFRLAGLLIFLVFYIPISISARVLPIPMGSFVPNLLIGALVGRIIGESCQSIYPSSVLLSTPGVFALVGAASMLGAWTRTMMAVVVTLLEVSGDIGMVSPLIVGVVLARSVATQIVDHSYTHELFYALIDDPDSDGPLILHPNDWKPDKKIVSPLAPADSDETTLKKKQNGVRLAVSLATPSNRRPGSVGWEGDAPDIQKRTSKDKRNSDFFVGQVKDRPEMLQKARSQSVEFTASDLDDNEEIEGEDGQKKRRKSV